MMFSCIGGVCWAVQESQFMLSAGQLLSLPALVTLLFLSYYYIVVAVSSTTSTTFRNDAIDENCTGVRNNLSPS